MSQQIEVLIIGGGGREHALAWKLAQSPRVSKVWVAPGNAGTAREAKCENIAIAADDIPGLLAFAQRKTLALTVVGPEGPLAAGIVDTFAAAGLRCFGPSQAAAQLESSKAYAKDFLARHRIPTAAYKVHTDKAEALADLGQRTLPVVIKADGLAAGKGVVIASTLQQAQEAVTEMLAGKVLAGAGRRVVIEDFLEGEEASFIVIASGGKAVEFATSQDHKRIGEGDTGPNTGGMGAYSPAPVVTEAIRQRALKEVIAPTLAGMAADGIAFTGFLYAGLMIGADGTPRVLEFNCRLGDPETQPLLMRLKSDLLELIDAALDQRLDQVQPEWDPRCALGVVLAAVGYPGTIRKGDAIQGLEAAATPDQKVFHAGTALQGNAVVTAGGRVLCACALGPTVREAQSAAYTVAAGIQWAGMQYRRDIGYRAVAREAAG